MSMSVRLFYVRKTAIVMRTEHREAKGIQNRLSTSFGHMRENALVLMRNHYRLCGMFIESSHGIILQFYVFPKIFII